MGIAPGVVVCGFRDDIRVHFLGICLLLFTGDEIAMGTGNRKAKLDSCMLENGNQN
jgi:hypothetical protein